MELSTTVRDILQSLVIILLCQTISMVMHESARKQKKNPAYVIPMLVSMVFWPMCWFVLDGSTYQGFLYIMKTLSISVAVMDLVLVSNPVTRCEQIVIGLVADVVCIVFLFLMPNL